MNWFLLFSTILISGVYLIYFGEILKGKAQVFEAVLMKEFAVWLMHKGRVACQMTWVFYFLGLSFEFLIFYLSYQLFGSNLFMQFFTLSIIGFEGCHNIMLSYNLKRFFDGQINLAQLFHWRLERIAAMLVFSYCLVASLANIMIHLI